LYRLQYKTGDYIAVYLHWVGANAANTKSIFLSAGKAIYDMAAFAAVNILPYSVAVYR